MKPHRAQRLAPLVPGSPILGNALDPAQGPVQFWVAAARKYGSVFRLRYPTAAGELTVMTGLAANEFAGRHGYAVFQDYICGLDGDDDACFRNIVKPSLSREAAGPYVQDMIRLVQEKAVALKDGSAVPVVDFLRRVTTDELSLLASGIPKADSQFNDLPYANGVAEAAGLCGTMLFALLKNLAVLKSVQAEVDAAFAEGTPSLRDLQRMTTLSNCLKEVYRRYPITPVVPRYVAKTFEFDGYTIPEGSYVFVAIVVPHFDERYFVDPYSFDPDRFAPPRSEGAKPYTFSPYGLDGHRCLSVSLIEVVVMSTMCGLVRSLDLELHPPGYELRFTTDPVPRPESAFQVRTHLRRPPGVLSPGASADNELEALLPGVRLTPEAAKRFAGGFERRTYSPHAPIIRQGAAAQEFFVLIDGEVEVERETAPRRIEHLAAIGPGGYFGEIGLLHGVPRTATVRAGRNGATVLAIGRDLFTHMTSEHGLISEEIAQMARRRMVVNDLIRAIPGLTLDTMAKVSRFLDRQRFAPDQVLMRQGDEPDRFYIIVSGKAEVLNHHPSGHDIVLAVLGPGEYFGEIGILHNRPRTATVRAAGSGELEVLSLEREHFLAMQDAGHLTGQAIAQKAMRRLVENMRL